MQTEHDASRVMHNTLNWTLTGIFAAVHAVLTYLPYSITLGATGMISMGVISGPLIGCLLGPFFGSVAVMIGSVVGVVIQPSDIIIRILTPLASTTGACCAGMIRTGQIKPVPIFYGLAMALFVVVTGGPRALPFLWFHGIALTLISFAALLQTRADVEVSRDDRITPILMLWVMAFTAVMLDQLVGSVTFAALAQLMGIFDTEAIATIFLAVLLIYPLERGIASVMVALLAGALIQAVRHAGVILPTEERAERVDTYPAHDVQYST
ncbi:MAG: hypothetical protein HXY34_04960 [Candidatus Thorarchaeota archaeon]|nr:hypothetical protein [Candidatus Thorarchaeota archaeon]